MFCLCSSLVSDYTRIHFHEVKRRRKHESCCVRTQISLVNFFIFSPRPFPYIFHSVSFSLALCADSRWWFYAPLSARYMLPSLFSCAIHILNIQVRRIIIKILLSSFRAFRPKKNLCFAFRSPPARLQLKFEGKRRWAAKILCAPVAVLLKVRQKQKWEKEELSRGDGAFTT